MAQTTESTKRKIPRGFKILLGVSLALNLAIVGLIAGAALRKGGDRPPRGGGHVNYAMPYLQALPHADRRAIFNASRPAERGGLRSERRALYRQVTEILRAEEFDRAAVEAVLIKQTEFTLRGQGRAQAQWLHHIEKMNLSERRAYADAVEDVLQRRPKHKRKQSSD